MARLGFAGAEIEVIATSTTPDFRSLGAAAATRDTVTFRSGAASAKCPGTAGNSAYAQWPLTKASVAATADTTYYWRFYFLIDALPTSTIVIGRSGSTGSSIYAALTSAGKIQLLDGTTSSQIGSDSVATIGTNVWYRVELGMNAATAGNGVRELRLEGVTVASDTVGAAVSASTDISLVTGWTTAPGATANMYVDDVCLNDSTGAAQNSWPGDGKVVLLKPISDNAVGTGWTLGTGTATGGNAFAAVDNLPPVGVADLAVGSDPKQIRNASANANVSYDANLTTYTNAGIAAADTVNVVLPMVATGAPVTTSAKAGTIGISANPVIANVALGAAGTSGAFWQGNTAGTYPTGWKWSFGTTTYAPSVTLGTSPVARITQVTSSTRIAMVCALGMYVDYTPAVVAAARTPTVVMAPYIPT